MYQNHALVTGIPTVYPTPASLRHALAADGLTTLVAGLALDQGGIAIRAAQLLSWLCTDENVLLAYRLPNTVMLIHMHALKPLSRLLNPEPNYSFQ